MNPEEQSAVTLNDQVVALLVDDNRAILHGYTQLLMAHGFVVIGVSTYYDAVREFRSVPHVDVVLTDINLPSDVRHGSHDTSGLTLAQVLRNISEDLPIYGYSGVFSEGELPSELTSAFTGLYSKGSMTPDRQIEFVQELKRVALNYRDNGRRRSRTEYVDLSRAIVPPIKTVEKPVLTEVSKELDSKQTESANANSPRSLAGQQRSGPVWKFLFSTNTWLSWVLAERFYDGKHFVWCTPYFEVGSQAGIAITTPPTSTPKEIYQALAMEVERNDRHSAKIRDNRAGLLRGSDMRLTAGEITRREAAEIADIVTSATIHDFRPLLYIIEYAAVAEHLLHVPVDQRAHPLSVEFRIERLDRQHFTVLELPRMHV